MCKIDVGHVFNPCGLYKGSKYLSNMNMYHIYRHQMVISKHMSELLF